MMRKYVWKYANYIVLYGVTEPQEDSNEPEKFSDPGEVWWVKQKIEPKGYEIVWTDIFCFPLA